MSNGPVKSPALLQPCPFCGADAHLWSTVDTEWVQCSKCFACTDVVDLNTGAVERWNRRVEPNEALTTIPSDNVWRLPAPSMTVEAPMLPIERP